MQTTQPTFQEYFATTWSTLGESTVIATGDALGQGGRLAQSQTRSDFVGAHVLNVAEFATRLLHHLGFDGTIAEFHNSETTDRHLLLFTCLPGRGRHRGRGDW